MSLCVIIIKLRLLTAPSTKRNAFTAMASLANTPAANFKLLFSLDYNSDPTWSDGDIISLMTEYGSNPHYFKVRLRSVTGEYL